MRPDNARVACVTLVAAILVAAYATLMAWPVHAQEAGRTVTKAEYRAELEDAIAALEAASDIEVAPVIRLLQEQFATITHVTLDTGATNDDARTTIAVSSILADLDPEFVGEINVGDEAQHFSAREVALLRLRGAIAQLDAIPTDNTEARLAKLRAVLARPEFNTPMTLWDRFWRWLTRWVSDLLPARGAISEAGWLGLLIRLLPWIVAIATLAAILWLLSYWLQRILRAFVTDARTAGMHDDGDLPATAAEARQQARAAAQSGNYRDAVRRLYLAALLQLAEHDLIAYERSLTNREVLGRVPEDSPIRPHLEPVVATFDRVWYGIREPDQATFHAYEQEIDQLAAVARRTPAGTLPTHSSRPERGSA